MKLTLKNIGKVRQAEIELKGITVIAGENDTGKSTVAKALVGMCNSFYDIEANIHDARIDSIMEKLPKSGFSSLLDQDNLKKVAQKIFNVSNIAERKELLREWSENRVGKPFRTLLDDNSESIDIDKLSKEIEERISLPSDKVLEKVVDALLLHAEFMWQARCVFNRDVGEITVSQGGQSIRVIIGSNKQEGERVHVDTPSFQMSRAVYIDNAVGFDEGKLFHHAMLREAMQRDFRQNNVVDELITDKKLAWVLNALSQVSKGDLIKGKLGDWRYNLKGTDKTIPLENLSAGIKAFATLKYLLENGSLQEGEILILDEPESHLHPKAQLVFAEAIVLLRKHFDLKILLNTHSPYFLHAIEVYSAEHEIADQCVYYLARERDGMAEMEDVSDSIDKIYKKLWDPIQDLEDIITERE